MPAHFAITFTCVFHAQPPYLHLRLTIRLQVSFSHLTVSFAVPCAGEKQGCGFCRSAPGELVLVLSIMVAIHIFIYLAEPL